MNLERHQTVVLACLMLICVVFVSALVAYAAGEDERRYIILKNERTKEAWVLEVQTGMACPCALCATATSKPSDQETKPPGSKQTD